MLTTKANNRHDALPRIATAMEYTLAEVEKKLHNVRSQYLREVAKVEKNQKTSAGGSDVYVPKWRFFSLLSFLSKHSECMPHFTFISLTVDGKLKAALSCRETSCRYVNGKVVHEQRTGCWMQQEVILLMATENKVQFQVLESLLPKKEDVEAVLPQTVHTPTKLGLRNGSNRTKMKTCRVCTRNG
ncbi:hypothetical protein J6590_081179 [Homalodisca vitripennis]|nr:hypothetical protein J6590_081179 [Homalodisca vitripennis]